MPLPLTSDTSAFWFFDSSNIELVVKVLDGRPVNGHFWVFYGALSNVQYTITVFDTLTGESKTYNNPRGQLASVADTSAFPPATRASPLPLGANVKTFRSWTRGRRSSTQSTSSLRSPEV